MNNLRKHAIGYIIHMVRKKRNSYLLINHLRKGGEIAPELAGVIADLLEGKYTASPKKPKDRPPKLMLTQDIKFLKCCLKGESEEISQAEMAELLKERGITYPESKGEITRTAEKLAAEINNLTISQLDEIVRPRKSRQIT